MGYFITRLKLKISVSGPTITQSQDPLCQQIKIVCQRTSAPNNLVYVLLRKFPAENEATQKNTLYTFAYTDVYK